MIGKVATVRLHYSRFGGVLADIIICEVIEVWIDSDHV